MALRTRLAVAFLAVVLGPVLLGVGFVAVTVGTVSDSRASERLDSATTSVQTAMNALCQRLHAAADSAAVLGGNLNPQAAQRVVNRQLAGAVQFVDAAGTVVYATGTLPARPWADCADPRGAPGVTAIAARVQVVDAGGHPLGYTYAVEPVDQAMVQRLATAAGAAVTVLDGDGDGAWSTERARDVRQVTTVAHALRTGSVGRASGDRWVRRIDRGPGQPLTLAMSVSREQPGALYTVLVAVVVLAGLLAIAAVWWLARSTARPLTELSRAVDRLADGDLGVRVPVRTDDEVGRLGATFNRMARELQDYLQALTVSRDQLRRHLGLVGDTLSSTHDVDRILEVILESALSATGAKAGVLLLADAASGMLIAQCAEGLDGRGPEGAPLAIEDLRVRMGEGLLGSVAATGEARRGLIERDGPRLAAGEPRCRTYVAVPFTAYGPDALAGPTGGLSSTAVDAAPGAEVRGPARGVLALYDRPGFDEFDDADVVTLRTFAGQASIALDNVRVHREAQRLSLTDPLTGLSNYRYLKDCLRREVERASRFGHRLTVLMLDLDHFKQVNDSYGHAAGDTVLAEFARRIRVEIREVDLAFRLGGEEFVVLLPETDAAGGAVLAERLGAAIRRTPVLVRPARTAQPVRIPVTVSIGIAVFPDHGGSGAAVLEAADDALYQAKSSGRDTYRAAPGRGEAVRAAAAAISNAVGDLPQASRRSHGG